MRRALFCNPKTWYSSLYGDKHSLSRTSVKFTVTVECTEGDLSVNVAVIRTEIAEPDQWSPEPSSTWLSSQSQVSSNGRFLVYLPRMLSTVCPLLQISAEAVLSAYARSGHVQPHCRHFRQSTCANCCAETKYFRLVEPRPNSLGWLLFFLFLYLPPSHLRTSAP